MEETNQVSIDIKESEALLLSSQSNETDNQICIFKVPRQLRENHEGAYIPQVISLGPFHHGQKELKAMDEHKQRFLNDFLGKSGKCKDKLLQFVMEREARLRNCYSEAVGLDSQEFGNMILVDAIFIIEFFYNLLFCEPKYRKDRLLSQEYLTQRVFEDLILLENQIPVFILHELLDFSGILTPRLPCGIESSGEAVADEVHCLPFTNPKLFIFGMMESFIRSNPALKMPQLNCEQLDSLISSSQHLLDFLRTCLVSKTIQSKKNRDKNIGTYKKRDHRSMLTATQLHQAGVQFKESGSESDYFDIQFDRKRGVLEIPSIFVDDHTESLFRNMVAFEQFYCRDERILTDYLCFLDRLIDVPRDVEILVENKILDNYLGEINAACATFNRIAKGLIVSPCSYFSDVYIGLNEYYGEPWHKWKAILRQKYFDSPWAVISVIAGALLLILTFVQTVFSIIK